MHSILCDSEPINRRQQQQMMTSLPHLLFFISGSSLDAERAETRAHCLVWCDFCCLSVSHQKEAGWESGAREPHITTSSVSHSLVLRLQLHDDPTQWRHTVCNTYRYNNHAKTDQTSDPQYWLDVFYDWTTRLGVSGHFIATKLLFSCVTVVKNRNNKIIMSITL